MYNLCIRSQSSTKPHVDNTTRALTVVVGEGLLHGLSSPRLQYILNPLMCCDTATRRSPLSGRAGLSDPSGYSWRSRDIHNLTPPYCSEQLTRPPTLPQTTPTPHKLALALTCLSFIFLSYYFFMYSAFIFKHFFSDSHLFLSLFTVKHFLVGYHNIS